MTKLADMQRLFIDPPTEFSPIPFWFWNDELSKEELIKQIHDFHAKEVDGFVIHPRMGMPKTMPYLSDAYMELVEAVVAEADRLGMKIILYDEGMYPSGSACGMVVKHNPEYASRGLELREYPCSGSGEIELTLELAEDEELVSVQAARKLSEQKIDADQVILLDVEQSRVRFTPPDGEGWSILAFVDTPSRGTIRGVHPGQDDGEPEAPLASDLLNPDAVRTFIELTHERYYDKLGRYFGNTIFAMFTDEPDLLGRAHKRGLKPWTRKFMSEYMSSGGRVEDLPLLWYETDGDFTQVREVYHSAVRNRLSRTYYKALSEWCEQHGIALTGHPAGSDDIGLLEHFHIPGQDVVWRFIGPEEGKALTGHHSTMGKCSSDAARHRQLRRNLNECFGVCGIQGGWTLSADNMKWYLDWLFARGVNLIVPHAFYYSIRGERRDERPPDVGPNNIWWSEYASFSRYIKRMSWLLTDSMNSAYTAILAGAEYLPWQIAKPLYEQQIEFNYLEEELLHDGCKLVDGTIEIAEYRYKSVLIEDGRRVAPDSWRKLESFVQQGGVVIELRSGDSASSSSSAIVDIGQVVIEQADVVVDVLRSEVGREYEFTPNIPDVRISRLTKDGNVFYVLINEGEDEINGALRIKEGGPAEAWCPWTGTIERAASERTDGGGQSVTVTLQRRESVIIAIDPKDAASIAAGDRWLPSAVSTSVLDLSDDWKVVDGPWTGELQKLTSWGEWDSGDLATFSGTVMYEKRVEVEDPSRWSDIKLDLGEAHELVRLWVNDREAGVRMWRPYVFDVQELLREGINELRVSVTNSLANEYDGLPLPAGLLGPVSLICNEG